MYLVNHICLDCKWAVKNKRGFTTRCMHPMVNYDIYMNRVSECFLFSGLHVNYIVDVVDVVDVEVVKEWYKV